MAFTTLPTNLGCKITTNSSKSRKDRILSAQFGYGYGQYAQDGLNYAIDVWNIEIAPLSGTDLTDMRTFLSTYGTTGVWLWTPLTENSAKKWRIDKDSIKERILNTTQVAFTFTITQQFDLG